MILVSCDQVNRKSSMQVSTTPLDTTRPVPIHEGTRPSLFEVAFNNGTSMVVENDTAHLYGVDIGNLKVSSGYLVACDPGHIDEYGIPFTQLFPKGEFPVQLAIAKVQYEETIAFARVKFSDEPVVKWEFALQKGQQQVPLGGRKKHGYSVDLGIGMFADNDAAKAIDKTNMTSFDHELYQQMDKNYRNDWKYKLYSFGKYNLAAFTSGLGDGYYATYVGLDAKGQPCRLLTDFGLFDWSGEIK